MFRLTIGTHLARIKTERAAVVPYLILRDINGNECIHFLFARDKITGEITDLGGGVKQHEFSLGAGFRELYEESDGVFGNLHNNINDHSLCIALVGDKMSVLFVPIAIEWYDIAPKAFQKKRRSPLNHRSRKRSHNEVSELLWIDDFEFKKLISSHNKQMWSFVRRFYQHGYNDDVTQALKIVYDF